MADTPTDTGAGAPSESPALTPAPAPYFNPNAGAPVNSEESGSAFGGSSPLASPIPIPKRQTDWEEGYQNVHGPRPSRWEAWGSIPFQEAAHSSLASPWGGALLRMLQEDKAQTGQMLDPETANQLYPGRPEPYTTPVDQGMALMEYNDRQKQQALDEWGAQRPVTTMGKISSFASGFVGGMTDPLNFAIGMASGGVSDLLAPEAAGVAGKIAAHYLGNLGGFTATEALQNLVEHQMGAKQKQLPEIIGDNAVPALVMTGIGVGLAALARGHLDQGGSTSERDVPMIKEHVKALENDEKMPDTSAHDKFIQDRNAGRPLLPPMPGNLLRGPTGATLLDSPLHETPLWAASHSDGTPLVHEHGLGPGLQLTDSHDVANSGVARSSETPGQIRRVGIPEGAKFLNLDLKPGEAEAQAMLEAIAKATPTPPLAAEESLKEVIQNLGDWRGAEVPGGTIPEDILQRIQGIARSLGYDGYTFNGEDSTGEPTNRQVHLFKLDGTSSSEMHFADPSSVAPVPGWTSGDLQGPEQFPKTPPTPAEAKTQDKFYDPQMEQTVHEFHKNPTAAAEDGSKLLTDVEKDIENSKQQLKEMSKLSKSAREALVEMHDLEQKHKDLIDMAQRIAECGDGGGV